jgi:hypothetical protein
MWCGSYSLRAGRNCPCCDRREGRSKVNYYGEGTDPKGFICYRSPCSVGRFCLRDEGRWEKPLGSRIMVVNALREVQSLGGAPRSGREPIGAKRPKGCDKELRRRRMLTSSLAKHPVRASIARGVQMKAGG